MESLLSKDIMYSSLMEVSGKVCGFCNFYVEVEWLANQIMADIFNNPESVGHFRPSSSLLIEHTSANPNGPFHVGRSRNGDTFVRMHRLAGDDVRAEYYVDDMGKQVGILAWALENLDGDRVSEILSAEDMDEAPSHPHKEDHKRVRYYQAANLLKEVDPDVESGVTKLVQASEEADAEVLAIFGSAYQPVLDGMLETLERLGIVFDSFTKESRFIVDGSVEIIMDKLGKSELHGTAENGAHFLELESRGVQGKSTKFFYQRGDGSSLYATRDIAYHQWKPINKKTPKQTNVQSAESGLVKTTVCNPNRLELLLMSWIFEIPKLFSMRLQNYPMVK